MQNADVMLEFFVRPDNLPDVLQIVQYAEQVRERVENDFWKEFRKRLDNDSHKPANFKAELRWRQKSYFDLKRRGIYCLPSWFCSGLECFVQPLVENEQGLGYCIQLSYDWFGHGLRWLQDAPNWRELCKRRTVKGIQEYLLTMRPRDIHSTSDDFWFCYEDWETNLCKDVAETWTLLAQRNRAESWYSEKTKSFWEFVGQTYELVIQANEELRKFKG